VSNPQDSIRQLVHRLLAEQAVDENVGDADSLFLSGRLTSLAGLRILLDLESAHGVDIATQVETLADIDSIEKIVALICRAR
jgi:acyl carrier protein